jgi:4-hydroxybenzoate polyprenyltransferase
MGFNMIWIILGIIAIISLVIYGRKRSAVWGGFTIGIVIGLMLGIISLFTGREIGWMSAIIRGAILGTIAGLFAELLGKAGDHFRKKES